MDAPKNARKAEGPETSPQAIKDSKRSVEAKWGKAVAEAGWTAVPNVLLDNQGELGLSSPALNVLLHVLKYWWNSGDLPYPSKRTIARAMGTDRAPFSGTSRR